MADRCRPLGLRQYRPHGSSPPPPLAIPFWIFFSIFLEFLNLPKKFKKDSTKSQTPPPNGEDRPFDKKAQEMLGTEEKFFFRSYWNCCSFSATTTIFFGGGVATRGGGTKVSVDPWVGVGWGWGGGGSRLLCVLRPLCGDWDPGREQLLSCISTHPPSY